MLFLIKVLFKCILQFALATCVMLTGRTSYPLNLEYDDITLKYCAYRFIYLYDSSAPRQTEELNTADKFFLKGGSSLEYFQIQNIIVFMFFSVT